MFDFLFRFLNQKEINSVDLDVVMCQKNGQWNCVKTSFGETDFRNWNHFCFTGGYSNQKNGDSKTFTLEGYFNGMKLQSSKSTYIDLKLIMDRVV